MKGHKSELAEDRSITLEFVFLLGFTALLLWYYRDPATTPHIVTGLVLLSWFMGFLGTVLLPLDLSIVMTSHKTNEVLHYVWPVVYWITFSLTWLILPIIMEYWRSGEFFTKRKVKRSIFKVVRHYGAVLALAATGILYAMVVNGFSFSSITSLLMAAGNTYGLLLLVALLGYGLVNIPRSIWYWGNYSERLRKIYFQAGDYDNEMYDAYFELEDAIQSILTLRERHKKLGNYMTSNNYKLDSLRSHFAHGQNHNKSHDGSSDGNLERYESINENLEILVAQCEQCFYDGVVKSATGIRGSAKKQVEKAAKDFAALSLAPVHYSELVLARERFKLALVSKTRTEQKWISFLREAAAIEDLLSSAEDTLLNDGKSNLVQKARATERIPPTSTSNVGELSNKRELMARASTAVPAYANANYTKIGENHYANYQSHSFLDTPSEGFFSWKQKKKLQSFYNFCRRFFLLKVFPHFCRVLAICCGLLSLVILWCEVTIGTKDPQSPLRVLFMELLYKSSNSETVVQAVLMVILSYMSFCTFHSLFQLKVFGRYSLHGNRQSDAGCLLTNSMYQCRLQFSLGYNFLLILHLPRESDLTSFHQLLDNMETIPLFGTSINFYLPLFLLVLCGFTIFNGYAKLLNYFGFEHYDQYNSLSRTGGEGSGGNSGLSAFDMEERISEGQSLVRRGRVKLQRSFQSGMEAYAASQHQAYFG